MADPDNSGPGGKTPNFSFFGSLWSLREYPDSGEAEWSWPHKFQAIEMAGFDGVMSPPIPALKERNGLRYWAITSLGLDSDLQGKIGKAADLNAEALTVQLGDVDSSAADMAHLASRIQQCALQAGLSVAIEIHRDTYLETPERLETLQLRFFEATGKNLEICWDFSHFAVVRHLRAPFSSLLEPQEDIRRSSQFHLRPFNGHHCQIPASDGAGSQTPEYREWLTWAGNLFVELRQSSAQVIRITPELGNASPAYGLSCYPDIWEDAKIVLGDLKKLASGQKPVSAENP